MMLLYLSSNEHIGIFDFLATEQGMILKKFNGTFYLKQFVTKDMRSLTHYDFFAIDMEALMDSEDEIIEAVMAFKSMYTSRMIFYFDKIKGNEDMIKYLIVQGFFNIVIDDEVEILQENIKKVTDTVGMSEQDAMKLVEVNENVDLILNNGYKFPEQEIKIALTGVMNRVGTTTMAFNLCHVLAGLGAKVCYIEANGNQHLKKILKKEAFFVSEDVMYLNGICFMDLYGMRDEVFDFIIYDMGVINERVVGAMKDKCDICVVCSTGKPYDLEEFDRAELLLSGVHVNKLFSFVDVCEQEQIRRVYGNVYFCEYTPDLFDSKKNNELWKHIMDVYIEIIN